MQADQRIAAAIGLFNEGRFEQALGAVGELLAGGPAAVDALNLAGACAQALGRLDDAERYWRQALARDPGHAASWNNLGLLLQHTGRVDAAAAALRRALDLNPAYVEARYHLGLLLQQAGATEEALACHEQVLALCPTHPAAAANAGLLLHRRADQLLREGRLADAERCYGLALARRPGSADLHNNAAVLQAQLGRPEVAEAGYRRALALRPDYADAWHNLGLLYMDSGRPAEAEAALLACVAARPGDPEALNSLGNLYQQVQRNAEAENAYRRAHAAAPAHAKSLNNLGTLYQRLGRDEQAEAAYRGAVAADPAYPEARWNLGFLLLSEGRLEEGWPWMEARHDPSLARPIARRPQLPCAQWRGEDLAGRAIVVWPEQGFGDLIQFVRYLPLLKEAGARSVTLVCPDPLKPLLAGVAGADQVLASLEVAALPPQDFWVLMLSLPMHFGTTLATIPARIPYLQADAGRVARWRGRIEAAGPGFRVGLVWRGFGGHVNDQQRSLPGLDCLAPLSAVPGVQLFSLQRGMDTIYHRGPAQCAFGVHDLGAQIADFADTAAIVAQLDLIVCVDTAVAHLAGALGKRCWVLLPAVHPDWRWLKGRKDTPWYPGALSLYRQERAGDWSAPVAAIAAELRALLGAPQGDDC